jgi:arabinoxylan arabinofuranohydrolase
VVKLKKDMITLDGEVIKMNAPNFFEAAWVNKHKGVYYFSYSTTPKAQMRFDYMTSDKPTSGFTYRGIVSDQPPINNNNHHAGQFEFKGKWYHVYHNRIVAKEAGIPTGFRRNLALDEFEYASNGDIKKVVFTTDGVKQQGGLDPFVRVEAETFQAQKGVETDRCDEGGLCLTDLQSGDWVKLVGVDFAGKGARKFSARAASATAGGKIEVRLDSPDGKLLGTCEIGETGGAQKWKSFSCDVSGAAGKKDLCLVFTGGGGTLFNFDCWKFE